MVDFKKRLGSKTTEKKTNPIEIYDLLDRKSETGPLRPAQSEILSEWYSNRKDDKDLIIKLHTGQGKTLIGLLILQSILNSGKGPVLYVCPNIYLVQQTFDQAQKFGIKCCVFEKDGQFPDDFLTSKRILITHVQKVFNGLTKFKLGTQSIDVDTIILDDSHACIDSIRESLTIKIPNTHEIYNSLIRLFSEDLKEQGEGSYLEILNKEYSTILPVPYWAWKDKSSSVLELLSKHKDDEEIMFTWPLIKDNIENCQCIISGSQLEITQYITPIWKFGTFADAKQRVMMSATTLDDSFFIKGLGIDVEAVANPLVYKDEKWSGEKMILIPSTIHHELDRVSIINNFAKLRVKHFGIVGLVPSFKRGKLYEDLGAIISKSDTIFDNVKKLKEHTTNAPVLFVNRYDGIDLPDEACRILIIDSKPSPESLSDRYEESRRENSDIVNIRIAQKIEQGLGRSVRGEKDYSVILIIGADLVNFIKSNRTKNYFSTQTQKQIDIGFEVAKMASEELTYSSDVMKELVSTMQQCIRRDEGWKEFYVEQMNEIEYKNPSNSIRNILKLEKDAEKKFFMHDVEGAIKTIQSLIDKFQHDSLDRGWYLQILARYQYSISKVESNKTQKSAFKNNHGLLNPKEGIVYEKLSFIKGDRIIKIKEFISDFNGYTELLLGVEENNSKLSFSSTSEDFEEAVKNLGRMLGFLSQRPDKEFKRGPDNLWCCGSNTFILFECKNEVDEKRKMISKTEAAQLNSAIAWFEKEYSDGKVLPLLVIHTKTLARNGDLESSARIMRKEKLYTLRKNVKNFFMEFKDYDIHSIPDEKIQEFLEVHKLDLKSLLEVYSEEHFHSKI